jgi:hypothetical protein
MQKLFILLAGIVFSTSLIAQQPDTSYHLLWYKGKKLKANTLLTVKKDTVRFDPVKSILKVTHAAGNGKKLDQMLKEFDKTPQRMNEMAKRMQAGMPKTLVPAYVTTMQDAYSGVRAEFGSCLSNSIQLPVRTFSPPTASKGRGPSFINYEPEEDLFEVEMQKLLAYYEAHKNEKITFVPTPPRREFTYCAMSDKGIEEGYERDFEQFRKELLGKDAEIWQSMLELSRYSQIMLPDVDQLYTNRRLDPLNELLLQRLYDRGVLLIKQFGDDPYRCWSLIKIILMIDRQLALIGWHEEQNLASLHWDLFEKALSSWKKMFEKAMQEYDYSVALNLHAILAIERMAQLHDLGTKLPLEKLLQFNRFKLNLHVSAKLQAKEGYQLTELEGDNWYSAVPDSTGKLVWILVGPLVNKITMNLKAAEFRGPVDFPYIGTRKWEGQMPNIKLDFCNRQADTLDIYMFHAQGHKETWVFPKPQGAIDILVVSGILAATFLDVERINETKRKMQQDPAAVEKLKKEMMAKLEYMKKQGLLDMSVPNNGDGLMRMSKTNELQRAVNDVLNQSRQYDPLKFVFTPQPHNRTPLIVQEKINGKELFPQNTATQYAWFHIKLEQDPNSPFPTHL